MIEELLKIRKWAEQIAGSWNGDLPGSAEDRAHQATEIMGCIDATIELINGMDNL